MKQIFTQTAEQLIRAWDAGNVHDIQQVHATFTETIASTGLAEKLSAFDAQGASQDFFKITPQYMKMVLEMLMFIRSARTGDWKHHLASLQVFAKYFFAHCKLTYARMIPLYLADV